MQSSFAFYFVQAAEDQGKTVVGGHGGGRGPILRLGGE
jgi:hypothetical protein